VPHASIDTVAHCSVVATLRPTHKETRLVVILRACIVHEIALEVLLVAVLPSGPLESLKVRLL